jgi:hypothetical protein
MQSILAIVASSTGEEPVIAVIAFAIGCWWVYFKMDRSDKKHQIEMKKLDKDKEK